MNVKLHERFILKVFVKRSRRMKRVLLQGISIAVLFLSISSYVNNYVEEIYKWKRVEYENLPKPGM